MLNFIRKYLQSNKINDIKILNPSQFQTNQELYNAKMTNSLDLIDLQNKLNELIYFTDTLRNYILLKDINNIDPGVMTFEKIITDGLSNQKTDCIIWFICGLINSYTYNTPVLLNDNYGKLLLRYDKTCQQIKNDLSKMIINPVPYLDKVYNIPLNYYKKTITLRELLNYDITINYDIIIYI